MTIWLWLSTPSIPIWKLQEKKPPMPVFSLNSYDYMPFLKIKKKSLNYVQFFFFFFFFLKGGLFTGCAFKIKVINQSEMNPQLFW